MRIYTRLVLGFMLMSLGSFAAGATFDPTEDTIYLQCENVDRNDRIKFVAVTPPTREASVFLSSGAMWTSALPLSVTDSIYLFYLDDGWTLMLDRVNLGLTELIKYETYSTSNSYRCRIVEQGAAEKHLEENPSPKPKI